MEIDSRTLMSARQNNKLNIHVNSKIIRIIISGRFIWITGILINKKYNYKQNNILILY